MDRLKTIVYVAGPYRAATAGGIRRNIEAARAVAERLWAMGYTVICPHLNSAFMDGVAADENFLRGDLEILRRCDAICMSFGWEQSSGARAELCEAKRLRKRVWYWDTDFLVKEEEEE